MQPATEHLLSARLARAQVDGRLPSLVAGLIRGSELVWTGAFGRVVAEGSADLPGPDTQYRIGSITKTFAAAR
jgi:CubicO group peptidase (beta-lactamase class C family)